MTSPGALSLIKILLPTGRIKSFPLSTSFHHGSPCSYISPGGMSNGPIGGRSSEVESHPIDIIDQSIDQSINPFPCLFIFVIFNDMVQTFTLCNINLKQSVREHITICR
jgi:hypothetical protein